MRLLVNKRPPGSRGSARAEIPRYFRPLLEQLEERALPALLASQVALTVPVLTGGPGGEVDKLLQRAAAATADDKAIVAVVDRAGNILGVRVEGNVAPAVTGDPNVLDFAI